MQDLLIDEVHRLIFAATVLHHPRVLPHSLKLTTPTYQESGPHQSNPNPQEQANQIAQIQQRDSYRVTRQPQPPCDEEGGGSVGI
jgi:hypothetical protein